ncbi:hypothetical protein BH11PSE2_BH11PSE2_08520 [soil metagenome]
MADLSEDILAQLPEDFQIQLAGQTDVAQAQIIEAVQAAHDDGGLADLNIDKTISDAADVSYRQDTIADLHDQQAQAVKDGDYDKAADLANQSEWQIREIQSEGGEGDAQLVQAEADQTHLHDASWEAATATEQANWSNDLAASGDTAGAEAWAANAEGHADAAVGLAATADQGGVYADHSYDSTASTSTVTDTAVVEAAAPVVDTSTTE